MSEILPTLEMVFLFTFFQSKGVNLTCVRNCVVVAEERPRINLTTAFSTLFSGLGLSPRAVSTSFGCRVNVAICTQVKMLTSSIVNVFLQITCHRGRWHIGVKSFCPSSPWRVTCGTSSQNNLLTELFVTCFINLVF